MAVRTEASFLSIGTVISVVVLSISGGMYVGGVSADVETLTKQQAEVAEDHDRLIRVEQDQKAIKEDVKETKEDVKEILKQLKELAEEIHNE